MSPGDDEAGGRAVEADLPGLALNGVGLEAGPVVDVEDGHLLVGQDVGQRHQLGVDGHRAHVVQVGPGHGGPVDLGLHHAAAHRSGDPFQLANLGAGPRAGRRHGFGVVGGAQRGAVVDEAHRPDPRRHQEAGPGGVGHGLVLDQRRAVHRGRVVQLDQRLGARPRRP